MDNLIEYRVDPEKLNKIRNEIQDKGSIKNVFIKKYYKILISLLILLVTIISSVFYYTSTMQEAQAVEFGLGNNYEEILLLNESLAENVPLSINSISTANTLGDKRVVALMIFLEKYKSPMASASVAKTFVDSADKYGFSDKWTLIPAISGIESGFGRLIPRQKDKLSYNAWGWSGGSKYGRWSYFESWEDAADKVSKGMANGYRRTNFEPEKIMVSYCPPCARPENNGIWAKTVRSYMKELQMIHDSL